MSGLSYEYFRVAVNSHVRGYRILDKYAFLWWLEARITNSFWRYLPIPLARLADYPFRYIRKWILQHATIKEYTYRR